MILTEKSNKVDNIKQKNQDEGIALDFSSLQNQAWNQMSSFLTSSSRGKKYDKEQIKRFLEYPEKNEKNLRNVSIHLFNNSGHYMRLIFYLARMLTLDYIITPIHITKKDIKTSKFKEDYEKATKYVDDFNIKHELNKILVTMISEDVFFGYERKKGRSSTIQKLPSEYCVITGMEDGLYTFSFDMRYFSGDKSRLNNFDSDFKKLYKKYEETNVSLQPLNTDKAVCLKFREDVSYAIPPFAMVFPEILDLEDSKELVKTKNILENFKLLLQKIPFKKDPKSEKDFIIGMDSVRQFHRDIKSVLPDQIGLITSPMDIEDFSFERKNNAISDNLKESKEGFYDSAGIPSSLFNAGSKSSIAIAKAVQSNESMMFGVLRQFERFFKRRLGQIIEAEYSFEVIFPDLTEYNKDSVSDRYLKMAQFGFPKSLVGASLGLSTSQLTGLTMLENDFLELDNKLVPLMSSHTMGAGGEGAGAKPKKDEELSDKGLETRDDETNKITKITKS